jgi:hypothetical protein
VPESDTVDGAAIDELSEELAPGVSSGLFEVLALKLGTVQVTAVVRQRHFQGDIADEACICERLLTTHAVLYVEDAEVQVPSGRQLSQNVQ